MAYAYTGTVLAAPLAERDAKPSLFKRIITAMIESRMRAAQREINAHAHLLTDGPLTLGSLPTTTLNTDSKLPFTG
ncbi:MAG: hypothetical protein ACRCUE_18260 [Bosea sp. (in: a-proteobacteria)]